MLVDLLSLLWLNSVCCSKQDQEKGKPEDKDAKPKPAASTSSGSLPAGEDEGAEAVVCIAVLDNTGEPFLPTPAPVFQLGESIVYFAD